VAHKRLRSAATLFPQLLLTLAAIPVGWGAVGEMVRLIASRDLGRQYSSFITVQLEHLLIQHGTYRMIRYPFYLTPSVPLVFRSPLSSS